jgi:hypothetical protein
MAQVPSNLIPTRVTELPLPQTYSPQGLLLFVQDGVSYRVSAQALMQALGPVSSVDASGGTTGLTFSGGPITSTGVLTLGGTLNVANGGTGVTTSTGTGSTVLSTSPTLVTPILGTPTSVTLTNGTGLPIGTGVSGLGTGVATALAVNVGSAGAPVVNGGALGTPSSGTLTNGTGLPLTTGVTGTLPIANGGTGAVDAPGARANLSAAVLGANGDITSLTGVTGGISSPDFVQLDTAAAASIAIAKLRWNVDTATAAFGIIDGTQEVNIGQQMYAQVVNADSVTITRGQAVYLFEATGNRASVKLASNVGDATSAKTLGLAAQSIAPSAIGFVMTQGVLDKVNTAAFAEGTTLYLGATAGSLTATKPVAPNHLVYIGVVERANAGNGQIYVKPQNGYELDEIHDVLITSPATGQVLTYEAATDLWKNSYIGGGVF